MSIATRINEMSSHIEQAYNELQGLGADLTNVNKNIENISMILDNIYDSMPQVSGEDISLTLNNTRVGKIKSTLKGNTSQDGTPTPDFPVDVNVVSGSNVIKTSNKNLFNKDTVVNQSNYSGSVGQVISIATNSNTFRCPIFKKISDKITISANVTSAKMRVLLLDKDYKILSTTGYTTLPKTIDTSNCEFIAIFFDGTTITVNNNIQIEQNSTATTYEPHQGKELPLDLPVVNLFDKDNETYTNGYIRSSATTLTTSIYNRTLYIPCKPNTTYAIQKMVPKDSSKFMIASSVDVPEVGVNIYNVVDAGANSTHAIYTTSNNAKYLLVNYIQTNVTSTTVAEMLNSIQIEKGSKVNAYTPFGTNPIELCKIGNYQDYFYKSGSKWYLHKEIGKDVLSTVNQEWGSIETSITGKYRYKTNQFSNIIKKPSSASNIGYLLCNYYALQVAGTAGSWGGNQGVSVNQFGTIFVNDNNYTNNLSGWKNWLDTTKPLLYFALEIPTNTEITDTTLISQLNALEQAMSYDDQTNISQENDNLPFIINATALMKNSD